MDSYSQQNPETAPLIDIWGIIAILWRGKITILACFVCAIALAFAYLMVAKPIYTANAIVLIDPREANTTSSPNVLGGIGTDSAAIASQVSIISSTESLREVFSQLNLTNDSEFNSTGLLGGLLGSSSNPEAAFDSFRAKLKVEREGLTYIINIGFTSTDAGKAARIANAIAAQYITGQVAEKSGVSSDVTDQLNQSITQLRQQVAAAETAVQNYRVENNLFDTGTGRTLVEDQVAQLNTQLSTARQTARDAASRYEQARAIGASASGLDRLSQFLNSGPAEQLRNTYNQRLTELANAQATLGPQHPTRIRLTAEIDNLTRQMRDEAARIITELKAASELATANVQRVQDDLTRLQTQSAMTNQQAVELRQLERNADASRQVLEQFLARSEQTSQLNDLQRPDARMVSEASPPLRAAWPRRSLVLAGAGLVGLMIGSVIALATDRSSQTAVKQKPDQPRHANKTQEPAIGRQRPPRRAKPVTAVKDLGVVTSRYQPPNHYLPSTDYLDAIHTEMDKFPDGEFAHGTQKLFDDLANSLPETAPIIVHLCGFGNRLEANRLAFALSQESRLAQWAPLIIDLDPLKKSRAMPRRGRTSQAQNDPATGLAVITPPPSNTSQNNVELIETLVYEYAEDCDIVFVIGKPLTDPSTLGAGFAGADANLIVLSHDENRRMAETALAKAQDIKPQTAHPSPPFLITIDHGNTPAHTPIARHDDEVSRAVADLRHLVGRRAS